MSRTPAATLLSSRCCERRAALFIYQQLSRCSAQHTSQTAALSLSLSPCRSAHRASKEQAALAPAQLMTLCSVPVRIRGFGFGLPAALASFPVMGSITVSKLEPKFAAGRPAGEVLCFNKGL